MNTHFFLGAIVLLALLYEFWLKEHVRLSFPLSFREYNLHLSHDYLCHADGWSNVVHITFTKHVNTDSLHKAIHEAVYRYHSNALVFKNFPPYNFPADTFEPFFFECLDFSHITYIDHRYSHLDTVSGALPCSSLVLPKNMTRFWFYSRCDTLTSLVIPSSELVHTYLAPECGCNEQVPIRVHSDFKIFVPKTLVDAYRTDEKWSSLKFVDEKGIEFHPPFLPYYPS